MFWVTTSAPWICTGGINTILKKNVFLALTSDDFLYRCLTGLRSREREGRILAYHFTPLPNPFCEVMCFCRFLCMFSLQRATWLYVEGGTSLMVHMRICHRYLVELWSRGTVLSHVSAWVKQVVVSLVVPGTPTAAGTNTEAVLSTLPCGSISLSRGSWFRFNCLFCRAQYHKFVSKGFTICTHTASLSQDLYSNPLWEQIEILVYFKLCYTHNHYSNFFLWQMSTW